MNGVVGRVVIVCTIESVDELVTREEIYTEATDVVEDEILPVV